jgi:hypothetical protein
VKEDTFKNVVKQCNRGLTFISKFRTVLFYFFLSFFNPIQSNNLAIFWSNSIVIIPVTKAVVDGSKAVVDGLSHLFFINIIISSFIPKIITMDPNCMSEEKTLFYDRVKSIKFTRSNGEMDTRAKVDTKLRLIKGERGIHLVAHFGTNIVLNANVRRRISSVSDDACMLSAYLVDQTETSRSGFQRQFHFTFCDHYAAMLFFNVFQSELPENVDHGPSFDQLQSDPDQFSLTLPDAVKKKKVLVTKRKKKKVNRLPPVPVAAKTVADLTKCSSDSDSDSDAHGNEHKKYTYNKKGEVKNEGVTGNDKNIAKVGKGKGLKEDQTLLEDVPLKMLQIGNYGESQKKSIRKKLHLLNLKSTDFK